MAIFTVFLKNFLGRGAVNQVDLNADAINVGMFNSPNFPDRYDNKLDCVWVITAPPGHTVEVTFTTFTTEILLDYVQVKDGGLDTSPLIEDLTGQQTVPLKLSSTGTQMRVEFHSDVSVTFEGFKANYIALSIPGLI